MGRRKILDTAENRARWLVRIMTKREVHAATGCWVFLGAKRHSGYSVIRYCGQALAVHRFVFQALNGTIPTGLMVCHRCDNPPCFNPAHLFLGNQTDNMRDAANKGRVRVPRLRGEEHPQAILSEAQIAELRALGDAGGISQVALARRFGVSQSHVSLVLLRRSRT